MAKKSSKPSNFHKLTKVVKERKLTLKYTTFYKLCQYNKPPRFRGVVLFNLFFFIQPYSGANRFHDSSPNFYIIIRINSLNVTAIINYFRFFYLEKNISSSSSKARLLTSGFSFFSFFFS